MPRRPPTRYPQRDENEKDFTDALDAIGAKWFTADTIDIVIGFRGVTSLCEVKHPDRQRAHPDRLKAQAEFREGWTGGPCFQAATVGEMLAGIGAIPPARL